MPNYNIRIDVAVANAGITQDNVDRAITNNGGGLIATPPNVTYLFLDHRNAGIGVINYGFTANTDNVRTAVRNALQNLIGARNQLTIS